MFSLLLIASLLCTTTSRRVDISCFCPNATSLQLPLQCITLPQCISDLPNCVQDNTTLEFEPCVHSTGHLSGMIPFSRRQSVHLQGLNSTIKCLGKVGFVFWRSDDLYIRGVNFQDCGGAFAIQASGGTDSVTGSYGVSRCLWCSSHSKLVQR